MTNDLVEERDGYLHKLQQLRDVKLNSTRRLRVALELLRDPNDPEFNLVAAIERIETVIELLETLKE